MRERQKEAKFSRKGKQTLREVVLVPQQSQHAIREVISCGDVPVEWAAGLDETARPGDQQRSGGKRRRILSAT